MCPSPPIGQSPAYRAAQWLPGAPSPPLRPRRHDREPRARKHGGRGSHLELPGMRRWGRTAALALCETSARTMTLWTCTSQARLTAGPCILAALKGELHLPRLGLHITEV